MGMRSSSNKHLFVAESANLNFSLAPWPIDAIKAEEMMIDICSYTIQMQTKMSVIANAGTHHPWRTGKGKNNCIHKLEVARKHIAEQIHRLTLQPTAIPQNL